MFVLFPAFFIDIFFLPHNKCHSLDFNSTMQYHMFIFICKVIFNRYILDTEFCTPVSQVLELKVADLFEVDKAGDTPTSLFKRH